LDDVAKPLPLPNDWSERFELGVTEFNEGKFYDCHETLERCWQEQGLVPPEEAESLDPHRQWVQGLIQISVAYHHLERGNVKGARKLMRRGYDRIKKFPLISYPLDLGPFEAIVQSSLDWLEAQPESDLPQLSVPFPLQFPKVAHK